MRCAACLSAIERGLAEVPGVALARLNLTERRLAVEWAPDAAADVEAIRLRLAALGYAAHPFRSRAGRPMPRRRRASG